MQREPVRGAKGCADAMDIDTAARETETSPTSEPGEPIIGQSPRRKVGSSVYVTVPGPVPMIKAKSKKK